jgi:hypothetical protein
MFVNDNGNEEGDEEDSKEEAEVKVSHCLQ